MVILLCLLVDLSTAETLRMPFASISKVTSIWNTARCRWNPGEVKLSKKVVVLRHGSLPLKHLDGDGRLIVAVGGEGLSLLGGDRGVPLDQWCHHTSGCLDAH